MAEIERMALGRDPVVANLLSKAMGALGQNDQETAHGLLRQAATLAPHDESIWWALLDVVDNEDDRVVCLENVLAINPNSLEARRLLRMAHIQEDIAELTPPIPAKSLSTMPTTVRPLSPRPSPPAPRRQRMRPLRLVLLMIVFGLLAAALAVVLSILLYGF